MTAADADERQATSPKTSSRTKHLSPDGKWRSFPKVPNLVQYVSTGTYFGRVKIGGKIFRESLETDVFTTAKLKLPDFIKEKQRAVARPIMGTIGEALDLYSSGIEADHTLRETSKLYRRKCVAALLKSWPGIKLLGPNSITELDCREWAARFEQAYSPSVFNNTLGTLRSILERAGIAREENPAFKIKRVGVRPKELKLPEPKQFAELLESIQTAGSRQSRHCADFVRFLAYSGCRLSEARQVIWSDVNFERSEILVRTAKRRKVSTAADVRFVPIIPPMRELLGRLKLANPSAEAPVCLVGECEKSMTNACKRLKIHRLTHHDLRHLFATRCIESGVDVPTVSRWLGHSDGGALAMKTYGHLRREHSEAMAAKVKF